MTVLLRAVGRLWGILTSYQLQTSHLETPRRGCHPGHMGWWKEGWKWWLACWKNFKVPSLCDWPLPTSSAICPTPTQSRWLWETSLTITAVSRLLSAQIAFPSYLENPSSSFEVQLTVSLMSPSLTWSDFQPLDSYCQEAGTPIFSVSLEPGHVCLPHDKWCLCQGDWQPESK